MRGFLGLLGAALLAGCTVGPDYKRPADAVIDAPTAQGNFVSGNEKVFVNEPPPGPWWRLYRDPALDDFVRQTLKANTDLRVAAATIARTQAGLDLAKEAQYPSTSLEFEPSYTRLSPQEQLVPFDIPPLFLYGLGGGLSYQVDLFGQIKRAIESSEADVGAARAAYDTVRITVVADTIRAYVQACSAGREISIAEQSAALQTNSTELNQRLFKAGRAISIDVTRAAALEDQVRSTIPGLTAQKRVALYRLAVLTGRPPSEFAQSVARCDQEPKLAKPIPIGDGAALLARRPDVRRAELELHAATARLGIVTADLYPKISFGVSAASIGPFNDIFNYDTLKYSIGPLISWEFPNQRSTEARIRAAHADIDAAYARFDGTVLAALQEVESALTVYARDLDGRALLASSRDHAASAAEDADTLFRAGRQNYLTVLDANRTLLSADQSLAAADTRLAVDQVNLFLALGGGWDVSDDA
ncbi:MAG TPA: TolC family protein [Aliidongia sp.]|nr:TolC family protein [Aliidongia sp.]